MTKRRGHAGTRQGSPRDLGTPTVVITHGAWVEASAWREVIALLQAKGLGVIAVQTPLTSLAADVDAVTRTLDHQSHPVVLVGHDYGGTVITQAGNHRTIAALVYVAAFAPDNGESTLDVQKGYPPPECLARLAVDAGGFLYLAREVVLEYLAQDLPAVESLVLAAAQQPIRTSALLDCVTEAAWHLRPCWYAVAANDRMIPAVLQHEMAGRIAASTFVLNSDHVPFLSRPRETGEVILAAVDAVRGNAGRGSAIVAPGNRG